MQERCYYYYYNYFYNNFMYHFSQFCYNNNYLFFNHFSTQKMTTHQKKRLDYDHSINVIIIYNKLLPTFISLLSSVHIAVREGYSSCLVCLSVCLSAHAMLAVPALKVYNERYHRVKRQICGNIKMAGFFKIVLF